MGILLAFLITTLPNGIIRLNAENGMAICRIDEEGPTTVTEVYLSKADDPENWKDYEYGDPLNVVEE